jgi:RsiW-degrading membrane proteinase PrsW (M82 family)
MAYLVLLACPVALVVMTVFGVQALGGGTPVWLLVVVTMLGGMLGRFAFSRIAVAHLRRYYPDYIQKELGHDAE